jgi:hypothetical protein
VIVRNPTGRPIRLEIVAGPMEVLTLEIGPHATVDLDRYQRALDTLVALAIHEPERPGVGDL